jgi:hypothetical protein
VVTMESAEQCRVTLALGARKKDKMQRLVVAILQGLSSAKVWSDV